VKKTRSTNFAAAILSLFGALFGAAKVVSEPDPQKNRKEGLGDRLGDRLGWKFTDRNAWNLVHTHFTSGTFRHAWA